MSFSFLWPIVTPVAQSIALLVGAWLAHRIATPKDHERAELLSRIAEASAALVVATNPGKPWADLLQLVVREISSAAGVPTNNAQAIRRAAAAALNKVGA